MVVGGPNARKDFHYNEGEEFFYQLEGDMQLPIVEDGKVRVIDVHEGEIFLLPPKVPHSPQRGEGTVGLVVERVRTANELDACQWYCESCNNLLDTATVHLNDIVEQLPVLLDAFYADKARCTCSNCGAVMAAPVLQQTADASKQLPL